MSQNGVQDVVAVGKDVSRHLDAFADGALDGKTAAIDFRLDVFDDNSSGKREFCGGIFYLGCLSAGQFAACGFTARDWQSRPPRVEFSRHSLVNRVETEEVFQKHAGGENSDLFSLFCKFITCDISAYAAAALSWTW